MHPNLNAINQRLLLTRRQTQQLPPIGSRPVAIAGRVGGWIGATAITAIKNIAGVRLADEALYINAVAKSGTAVTTVLNNIALALADAGCIRSWRDEQLDVIAEGNCIASLERGAFRPLGLLTQAVHMNAWTRDGGFWAARRALSKSTDPGKWDTLSGGLVGAGEDTNTALLRETYEEAGLKPATIGTHSPLRTVLRMHRRLPDGYQVENVLVSDCQLADDVTPTGIDGEVMEFRCLKLAELWDMIVKGAFTVEAELAILDSLQHQFQLTEAGPL